MGVGMGVGIGEPVPVPLQRLLRRAVVDLARAERRRQFPAALHAGVPGGSRVTFSPADDAADHALRVDVVEAMLRRLARTLGPPLVWLARPGPLRGEDADLQWHAAVRAAAAELRCPARFVTVCRTAWLDPATGVGREWHRAPRVRR
jgi:hypothetical protein